MKASANTIYKGGTLLDTTMWIYILLLLFIVFSIQEFQQKRTASRNNKKKREGIRMPNELVEKYLGKTCLVSTGTFGSAFKGEITEIKDNWIEITDKKAQNY